MRVLPLVCRNSGPVKLRNAVASLFMKYSQSFYFALFCAPVVLGAGFDEQKITISVAPFAGVAGSSADVGKRTSAILNLQIWQTLRIPPNADGQRTKGTVTWDFDSHAPVSVAEAEAYAAAQKDQEPQIVLWGKAWRYGTGTVVEAFLLIRSGNPDLPFGSSLWTVNAPSGGPFSVGIPSQQVEFKPIVLRAELMPELTEPAGLKLYASASGLETLGYVGDYFTALEQGPDSARVVLPNGKKGWIRLPNLSHEHSEVVDFAGGLVRILRKDWDGASRLFRRVADNAHAPMAVKGDAYLYLAIAAAHAGQDPALWIQKAYDVNPYSRTTLQYLCMAQLAKLAATSSQTAWQGSIERLDHLVESGKPLYAWNDRWFNDVKVYLARIKSVGPIAEQRRDLASQAVLSPASKSGASNCEHRDHCTAVASFAQQREVLARSGS